MASVEPAGSNRNNMMLMRDSLSGVKGSKMKDKRKNSLSHWTNFKTVSWRADAQKDYDEHTSVVLSQESSWIKAIHEAGTWLIPACVGICTATSGAFIEKSVEWFAAYRLGYCPSNYFYTTPENCPNWVPWKNGYLTFIGVSTFIATVSATLTFLFAPMSRGSGIPEIKTILGGFTFPEVLAGNTLVIKIIGLSMSVGAGLSCGKEGPLVHIACCWSNFISRFVRRYRENEAKQRELLSCACAAGVAVAFGAPLGGVLFSYEEASTIFPARTMLRSFFAASIAAVTLAWWNPTGSGKLTMFNEPYNRPPFWTEYPIFIVLGVVGGCIGALFVHYNILVSKNRAPGTWFRKRCHIVLEVCIIGLVTAITSYHLLWTRVLSNVTIRALFHDCKDLSVSRHEFMLDICDEKGHDILTMELVKLLAISGFLRFVQMVFTFGTGAAAGLFIPSLYVGAALGRITGIFTYMANDSFHFVNAGTETAFVNGIYPGMYAMLGAAAVLGGVCRVTISLVVIMFELTGGLQLIVPFMVVCTLAKWVGDAFTIGIYDYIIIIRKYPFLHEPDEITYHTNAGDVMDETIDCLHPDCGELGPLIKFLKDAKHGGYPLTQSATDPTLLGYIHTKPFLKALERQLESVFVSVNTPICFAKFLKEKPKNVLDMSKHVDETVMTAVPETPAAFVQQIFRNLGVKLVLIRRRGALVGMITKKSFITQMEELHSSEHAHSTHGGLKESLLPK